MFYVSFVNLKMTDLWAETLSTLKAGTQKNEPLGVKMAVVDEATGAEGVSSWMMGTVPARHVAMKYEATTKQKTTQLLGIIAPSSRTLLLEKKNLLYR